MNHKTKRLSKRALIVSIGAALCGASSLNAQDLFFENFDDGLLGSPIHINSGSNYDIDRRSESINPFPTAQGGAMRIRDRTDQAAPSIEWELSSAVSAAAFSFDFNAFEAGGTDGTLRFGIGQKTGSTPNQLNTGDNMIAFAIINPDSLVYRQAGSGSNVSSSSFTQDTNLTLDIFVNDFDSQAVNYTRPDNGQTDVLGANTVAYWFNGLLVGLVDFSDGTVGDGSGNTANLGSSEGNIGRFGFNGLTSNAGIVSHYDNISVSSLAAVPEPSTYALLFGALALGFAVVRRR